MGRTVSTRPLALHTLHTHLPPVELVRATRHGTSEALETQAVTHVPAHSIPRPTPGRI